MLLFTLDERPPPSLLLLLVGALYTYPISPAERKENGRMLLPLTRLAIGLTVLALLLLPEPAMYQGRRTQKSQEHSTETQFPTQLPSPLQPWMGAAAAAAAVARPVRSRSSGLSHGSDAPNSYRARWPGPDLFRAPRFPSASADDVDVVVVVFASGQNPPAQARAL